MTTAVLFQRSEVTEAMAALYQRAALDELDMSAVASSLETARKALVTTVDPLDTWEAIDGEIGKATDATVRSLLVDVRGQFITRLSRVRLDGLRTLFAQDVSAGWRRWKREFGDAVMRGRFALALAYTSAELPFPSVDEVGRLSSFVRLMLQQRYVEAYPTMRSLALDEELSVPSRVQALVDCAQIEMYFLERQPEAREWLERAAALDPDHHEVDCGRAQLALVARKFDDAATLAQRSIERRRDRSRAYVIVGDIARERGELNGAQQAYERAMQVRPWDVGVYTRLIGTYARAGTYEARSAEIARLVETVLALDPDDAAGSWVSFGDTHRENERKTEMRACYEKALALEPNRLATHIAMGIAAQKDDPEEARRWFDKAIALAPQSLDGHWFAAELAERQADWRTALAHYRRCLELRPEWTAELRRRIGLAHWQLEEHEEAERKLLSALEMRPDHATTIDDVNRFGLARSKTTDGLAAAVSLFDRALTIAKGAHSALIANQKGNVLHSNGDYTNAIDAYRRAIELDPKNVVLYSNLVGSLTLLNRWDDARAVIEDGRQATGRPLSDALGMLENRRANREFSSERWESACEGYLAAIRAYPDEPIYFSNVARALANVEMIDRAPIVDELARLAAAAADRLSDNAALRAQAVWFAAAKRFLAALSPPRIENELGEVAPAVAIEWPRRIWERACDASGSPTDEIRRAAADLAYRLWSDFGFVPPTVTLRPSGEDEPTRHALLLGDVVIDTGWIDRNAQTAAIFKSVEKVIRKYLDAILGHEEVVRTLRLRASALADEVLDEPGLITDLTAVCRALVTEGGTLAPFVGIVQRVRELRGQGIAIEAIVEEVRMLPDLLAQYAPNRFSDYMMLPISRELEEALSRNILESGDQPVLEIDPQECIDLLRTIREGVNASGQSWLVLVVDAPRVRPFTRRLVELEYPYLFVHARREIDVRDPKRWLAPLAWPGNDKAGER